MALRIVNTTPGDFSEPLLPGAPLVFSVKSDTEKVLLASVDARLGVASIVHRGALPEQAEHGAEVSVDSAERQRPIAFTFPRFTEGQSIIIGPGGGPGVMAGVYELRAPVKAYETILASVSFRVNKDWAVRSRPVSDQMTGPLYLGLEYGIKNTGLFALLGDGVIVSGGPLLAQGTARPLQQYVDTVWENFDGEIITVYFLINGEKLTAELWVQLPGEAPEPKVTVPLEGLRTFPGPSSGASNRRPGPRDEVVLFFGNCGSEEESVEIVDYALWTSFPEAIKDGEPAAHHQLKKASDLPVSYSAASRRLPTHHSLSRWNPNSISQLPEFWYQPGRPTTPLYFVLKKSGHGESLVSRNEPRLAHPENGFSVEAWMSGALNTAAGLNSGIGFRVNNGQRSYQVVALDSELVRSYGIISNPAESNNAEKGYHVPRNADGTLQRIDYRSLRLVRLTLDPLREKLMLFVEDMDRPALVLPASTPLPPAADEPHIGVGHVSFITSDGESRVAALNYTTHYRSWESSDLVPPTEGPVPFLFETNSADSFRQKTNGTLVVDKESFGPSGTPRFARFRREELFSLFRGFQLDFRCRVAHYTDDAGVSAAPRQWTGAGVTVHLGDFEGSIGQYRLFHLGFFDCGAHGRKIGIIPGRGSVDDILDQTLLGKLHSADADFMTMGSYRLVYRPFDRVEVYGSNLIKDAPIISIPWNQFETQIDDENIEGSLSFGQFSSENSCKSEWEFVRWGIASGYEFELTPPVNDSPSFGGRVFFVLDAEEHVESSETAT